MIWKHIKVKQLHAFYHFFTASIFKAWVINERFCFNPEG
jgi:hypothetical protein